MTPRVFVSTNLIGRLGGVVNPAKEHPKGFLHMQQPSLIREPEHVDLTEPEPPLEMSGSENEDSKSGEETEEDEITANARRHFQTRAQTRQVTPSPKSGKQPGSSSKTRKLRRTG